MEQTPLCYNMDDSPFTSVGYRAFYGSDNLRIHQIVHRGFSMAGRHKMTNTENMSYSCDVSSETFSIADNLQKHRRTYNGEK